jgi:hypothetical protein
MNQAGHQRGRTETWVGLVILLCLAAVAAGVFIRQFSFNPAVLVARTVELQKTAVPNSGAATPAAWRPPELKEFGPPESFTPENLYDKIDGKAELYLSAGFVRLNCQRFALADAQDQWLEWFVYDMGAVPQAFSVFTVQRRSEGQPLDFTEYAYKTQNSLYFICGSNYVEAVASSVSEPLMNAMLAAAKRFIATSAPGSARLPGLELLPAENQVPESQTLQSADVFGFDQFKNVYTAEYTVGDARVLAFVTSCTNPGAAAALRDAYRAFLLENGGKESHPITGPDKPVEILGSIEMVFSEGPFVAGIHSAASTAQAEQVATQLHKHLAQKAK